MRLLNLKSYKTNTHDKTFKLIKYCLLGFCHLLYSQAFAEIDLEAMVEPIHQKTWTFVRIIEGLIMGSAGWRMLTAMSLSPLVVGVIGVTVLELIKQFLK